MGPKIVDFAEVVTVEEEEAFPGGIPAQGAAPQALLFHSGVTGLTGCVSLMPRAQVDRAPRSYLTRDLVRQHLSNPPSCANAKQT